MRTTKLYTFNGEALSIPQWAHKLGIKEATLRDRITQRGWPLERALAEPVVPGKKAARK